MIEAFAKRPAGAVVLGVLGVLGVAALALPYTVDDAFIVARYAQNLAAGHGYAMNPDDVPSDGITGPFWIVPPLLAAWLSVDPVLVAKLTGGACAALAVWLVVRRARHRALGQCASWVSAAVLACVPDVGTWSVSGLETGAALLALSGLAIALLERAGARFGWAVLATSALSWLRPELVACALVLWIAAATRAPRRALPWAGIALAGAASVIVWRLVQFGHALPLSASAKPADLEQGARYALRALVLTTSGIGAVLATFGARGQSEDRWLCVALATHGAAVALAGGDWMPGARLFVPVMGLYALLVGRGVALLGLRRPALALSCLALALSVPLLDLATRVPELRASALQREQVAAALARRLRARGQTIALLDAGYLAYASGLPVVDLGGLTDSHIARLPGGHIDKRVDEAYLRARNPGVLVLHSTRPPQLDDQQRVIALWGHPVEQRVAALPWVREHFRFAEHVELRSGYGYVVLERAVSPPR